MNWVRMACYAIEASGPAEPALDLATARVIPEKSPLLLAIDTSTIMVIDATINTDTTLVIDGRCVIVCTLIDTASYRRRRRHSCSHASTFAHLIPN